VVNDHDRDNYIDYIVYELCCFLLSQHDWLLRPPVMLTTCAVKTRFTTTEICGFYNDETKWRSTDRQTDKQTQRQSNNTTIQAAGDIREALWVCATKQKRVGSVCQAYNIL